MRDFGRLGVRGRPNLRRRPVVLLYMVLGALLPACITRHGPWGEALLELSSADLEELKVLLEHSSLMLARIQDLPRTRSTTP